MKRSFLAAALFALLLMASPARANWICGVMDPYPGYGHPSFYFPPAVAAFYAGYGYPSLIPGHYYAPSGMDPHLDFGHLHHQPYYEWHQAVPLLAPHEWVMPQAGFAEHP